MTSKYIKKILNGKVYMKSKFFDPTSRVTKHPQKYKTDNQETIHTMFTKEDQTTKRKLKLDHRNQKPYPDNVKQCFK